jgi:hypothetical protein
MLNVSLKSKIQQVVCLTKEQNTTFMRWSVSLFYFVCDELAICFGVAGKGFLFALVAFL